MAKAHETNLKPRSLDETTKHGDILADKYWQEGFVKKSVKLYRFEVNQKMHDMIQEITQERHSYNYSDTIRYLINQGFNVHAQNKIAGVTTHTKAQLQKAERYAEAGAIAAERERRKTAGMQSQERGGERAAANEAAKPPIKETQGEGAGNAPTAQTARNVGAAPLKNMEGLEIAAAGGGAMVVGRGTYPRHEIAAALAAMQTVSPALAGEWRDALNSARRR